MMKQLVLGLAAIAAVSACSKSGDPKAVVAEFTQRGESGNCSGLRDYIVSAQQASMGQLIEQGCQSASQAKKAGTSTPPTTIGDATVNGDRATVKTTSGGRDSNVVLVKENGAWKIDIQATMQGM